MSIVVQRVVFNLPTSLAITVFTPTLAGCLLLLSWLQHRTIFALARWGSGFLIAAVATTLIIIARGTIPDFWSIVIGNALIALAYGVLWSGVRNFEGKRLSVVQTTAGAIVWLASCLIGPIYAVPAARATVLAAIAITYTLLSLLELWRGRDDGVWRWPIMLLLLIHTAVIPIRIQLAGPAAYPDLRHVNLVIFAIFERVFVCICAAYLFGGLAKDRIAVLYRRASLIDPLTGVANRRNFSQVAERMIARARFTGRPSALLLFDLDHFKSINDTFRRRSAHRILFGWPLRCYGRQICSAGSAVRSLQACCRIPGDKMRSCWQSGCDPRSKPPPPYRWTANPCRGGQRWGRHLGRCKF